MTGLPRFAYFPGLSLWEFRSLSIVSPWPVSSIDDLSLPGDDGDLCHRTSYRGSQHESHPAYRPTGVHHPRCRRRDLADGAALGRGRGCPAGWAGAVLALDLPRPARADGRLA